MAPNAVIYLKKDNNVTKLPSNYAIVDANGTIKTKQVIIIEENLSDVYIADPHNKGGPFTWRREWHRRPDIISIKREDIADTEYIADTVDHRIALIKNYIADPNAHTELSEWQDVAHEIKILIYEIVENIYLETFISKTEMKFRPNIIEPNCATIINTKIDDDIDSNEISKMLMMVSKTKIENHIQNELINNISVAYSATNHTPSTLYRDYLSNNKYRNILPYLEPAYLYPVTDIIYYSSCDYPRQIIQKYFNSIEQLLKVTKHIHKHTRENRVGASDIIMIICVVVLLFSYFGTILYILCSNWYDVNKSLWIGEISIITIIVITVITTILPFDRYLGKYILYVAIFLTALPGFVVGFPMSLSSFADKFLYLHPSPSDKFGPWQVLPVHAHEAFTRNILKKLISVLDVYNNTKYSWPIFCITPTLTSTIYHRSRRLWRLYTKMGFVGMFLNLIMPAAIGIILHYLIWNNYLQYI